MKTAMIVDDSQETYSPGLVEIKSRYKEYNVLTSHDIITTVKVSDRLKIYKTFIDIADVVHFTNLNEQSDMSKTLYDYAVLNKKSIVRNKEFANDQDKFIHYINELSLADSRCKLTQVADFDYKMTFVLTMLDRAKYSTTTLGECKKVKQQPTIEFEEAEVESE